MPDNRRVWTEDDIAKLKDIAGRIPREEIAAQLGRTVGATAVEASKLGLSLRRRASQMTHSSVTDQTTVEWQRAWIQELKQKLRQRLVARRIRQEITVRAREIWEQNGRPSGRDEEFWLQAETEITERNQQ